jgi:hypothetical protein
MKFLKYIMVSTALLSSGAASAAEMLRLFPIWPTTTNNVIGTLGTDLPVTEIAVNTVQLNVFQPCGVLQFGGFTKMGNCGVYKAQAQLWSKAKSLVTNTAALPIAVLQYPSSPSTAAYATPNGQPFIVGNIIRYTQQSCDPTLVDTTKYVTTTEPCTGTMQVWRRTTPVQ